MKKVEKAENLIISKVHLRRANKNDKYIPIPTQTDDFFQFKVRKKIFLPKIKEIWDHDCAQDNFCGENIYEHNINEVQLSPD